MAWCQSKQLHFSLRKRKDLLNRAGINWGCRLQFGLTQPGSQNKTSPRYSTMITLHMEQQIKHLITSLPDLCRWSSAFPVSWKNQVDLTSMRAATGHPKCTRHAAILHDGFNNTRIQRKRLQHVKKTRWRCYNHNLRYYPKNMVIQDICINIYSIL